LRLIGLATANYRASHNDEFPMGGGDSNWFGLPVPRSFQLAGPGTRFNQDWGWAYQILPYLEADTLWRLRHNAATFGPDAPADQAIASAPVAGYFCPSRRAPQVIDNAGSPLNPGFGKRAAIDYAGNLGIYTALNGNGEEDMPFLNFLSPPGIPPFRSGLIVKSRSMRKDGTYLYLDQPLRGRDATDGLSYTVLIAEKRLNLAYLGQPQVGDQMGYTCGYGTTALRTGALPPLRDTRDAAMTLTDQFGSSHPHGLNVLFGDGSVRGVRYNLAEDLQVCVVWLPPLVDRGVFALPPPHPPNAIWSTLWQRLCHRNDGGTIDIGLLD
jgi:prepilin-type processing-associated H-X9-DG protein